MEKLSEKELFNKLKNCISENHCIIKRDYDEEIKNSKYFTSLNDEYYSESRLLNGLKNEMDYIYSCYKQIIKDPENILKLTDWDYDKDTKDIEKDLLKAEFKINTMEKILDLNVSCKILTFTFKYGKLLTFDFLLNCLNDYHYYNIHFHYLYRL